MKRLKQAPRAARWRTAALAAVISAAAVPSRPMAARGVAQAGFRKTGPGQIVACWQTNGASATAAPWIVAIDVRSGKRQSLVAGATAARLAPDGRALTFRQNDALWTRSARGVVHRVGLMDAVPVWSPDGRQIVASQARMTRENRFEYTTWRFNADGTHKVRLPIPSTDGVTDWSADGNWLLTTSDRLPPYGRGYQIYRISPDGVRQRRLTPPGGLNGGARFSPRGRRIIYSHQEHGVDSLWVVDVDGRHRRCLFLDANVLCRDTCLSPDGKQIAVVLEEMA